MSSFNYFSATNADGNSLMDGPSPLSSTGLPVVRFLP